VKSCMSVEELNWRHKATHFLERVEPIARAIAAEA